MLCLQNETNPEWIDIASIHIDDVLIDHAHCEKKAAANALFLIQKYPQHTTIVQEMILVLKEEWEHFELVFSLLQKKGIPFRKDKGDHYAQQLSRNVRGNEPGRLLDMLLIDALIEARSCERFSILSKCKAIPQELREFYHSLLASEAGHYRVFTDLAKDFFPAEVVKSRLLELSTIEAEIVRSLKNLPLMHG